MRWQCWNNQKTPAKINFQFNREAKLEGIQIYIHVVRDEENGHLQ